jgi:hypothetical protein
MECAIFKKLQDAADWRAEHGGWIFVSDACVRIVWFAPHFTPSVIMRHDATKGFSGAIV